MGRLKAIYYLYNMAKAKKKEPSKSGKKPSIKGFIKDVMEESVEPPPQAFTPPEKPSKKSGQKK
jgi:hypothetical protein